MQMSNRPKHYDSPDNNAWTRANYGYPPEPGDPDDVEGMLRSYRYEINEYKGGEADNPPYIIKHLCWLLGNALDALEAEHKQTPTPHP
jgi:hypothetical protein